MANRLQDLYGTQPPSRKRRARDDDEIDNFENSGTVQTTVAPQHKPIFGTQPLFFGFGSSYQNDKPQNNLNPTDDIDALLNVDPMMGTSGDIFPNANNFGYLTASGNFVVDGGDLNGDVSVDYQDQMMFIGEDGNVQGRPLNMSIDNNFASNVIHNISEVQSPPYSASNPMTPNFAAYSSTVGAQIQTIPLQEPATASIAAKILTEERAKLNAIKIDLEKLKWEQKEALSAAVDNDKQKQMVLWGGIEKKQQELRKRIEETKHMFNRLLCEYILEPIDICRVASFSSEIDLESRQLEAYETELLWTMKPQANSERLPALLIITKQPFPRSVKQGKPMEDSVTVRLLTGTYYQVWPTGPVRADIVTDYTSRSKKNPVTVQNNTKPMQNNIADFNDLIIPHGTRKKTIHLKFAVEVQITRRDGSSIKRVIESDGSKPFIVKTNENQWEESEGILLKTDAFGTQNEVPWYKFVNALQKRYLLATKQDLQKPARPLSVQDINYIFHIKFKGPAYMHHPSKDSVITVKQYEQFWDWFGPGLHKIRYQRHMCPLWVRGLICGFINRAEADQVLAKAPAGTFLIRFSERHPGGFAIAYVASEEPLIRHYLIQSDDVFGAKKTLPDFLGSAKNFEFVVQINTDDEGNRIYRQLGKDASLAEFYAKRNAEDTDGYDNQLDTTSNRLGSMSLNQGQVNGVPPPGAVKIKTPK